MRFATPIIILFFTSLSSCLSFDDVNSSGPQITGRWELERATRNGMETQMLEGLYYDFTTDSTLETNLMGNESPGSYSRSADVITTEGLIPPLTYEIRRLTDSTMRLRTELQGFQFDFELARPKEAPAQEHGPGL